MKRFWLIICGWVVLISLSPGETSLMPVGENALIPIDSIGGSIAPYVDKDGYVNPIVNLGEIDFGRGLTLPLVLNFSSAIRPPSPEFGQGWECPLFEAKIFDVQQNVKKVETLGGKEIYLIYNPRNDTWKHFFSDAWKGQATGDDFTLTYVTGCQFVFHKGLISSMTTPDGRTVQWNRNGDKLDSLSEGGTTAVKVVYDKLGFAKQLLLLPDKLGASQDVYDFTPDLVSAGIGKISGPGGRVIIFNRSRDTALNPILSWTDTQSRPVTVSWSLKTGKILSDDKYAYDIQEVQGDNTWPQMLRKNKTTKKIESYYFDPLHGTTDEKLPDGTLRHIEMVQAPGPNYKKVRLIQDTKNSKTVTVLRRSFDDQGHLLLEAMGLANGKEQVKQYLYDNAGRITEYMFNGKEMWKNVYDDTTGQLKERDLPNLGVKMAFDEISKGEVTESIIKANGAIASSKTLTPALWQSTQSSLQQVY